MHSSFIFQRLFLPTSLKDRFALLVKHQSKSLYVELFNLVCPDMVTFSFSKYFPPFPSLVGSLAFFHLGAEQGGAGQLKNHPFWWSMHLHRFQYKGEWSPGWVANYHWALNTTRVWISPESWFVFNCQNCENQSKFWNWVREGARRAPRKLWLFFFPLIS